MECRDKYVTSRPQLAMYRLLPLLDTQIPLFGYINLGGGGVGGALILDRCRAFNLFASVDAHLCTPAPVSRHRRQISLLIPGAVSTKLVANLPLTLVANNGNRLLRPERELEGKNVSIS
jgi:hypothetical protein